MVPEFPTSITLSGVSGCPFVPFTVHRPLLSDISAPKALHAFRQDLVSDESRGWSMILSPSAREAIIRARIVWDFDPGIWIIPSTSVFRMVFSTAPFYNLRRGESKTRERVIGPSERDRAFVVRK